MEINFFFFFFWLCSPLEHLDFSHPVLSRETNVSVHTEKLCLHVRHSNSNAHLNFT